MLSTRARGCVLLLMGLLAAIAGRSTFESWPHAPSRERSSVGAGANAECGTYPWVWLECPGQLCDFDFRLSVSYACTDLKRPVLRDLKVLCIQICKLETGHVRPWWVTVVITDMYCLVSGSVAFHSTASLDVLAWVPWRHS